MRLPKTILAGQLHGVRLARLLPALEQDLAAQDDPARPSLIPLDARIPRAQGSSGATATVPFVLRGHTKSRTTRAGRALELALRLG